MNTTSKHTRLLRSALEHPTRGVVGLVDDLLKVCREHRLQLDWQPDRCRVRSAAGDWEELLESPLRKSVFRAILARVAALCNERTPNSVSPYAGQAELFVGPNPPALCRVAFVNTPEEQKLELMTETELTSDVSPQRGPFAGSASGAAAAGAFTRQGIIKKLVSDRGFGFISSNGQELFFHHSSVQGSFESLTEGQTVEFEIDSTPNAKGNVPRAVQVKGP